MCGPGHLQRGDVVGSAINHIIVRVEHPIPNKVTRIGCGFVATVQLALKVEECLGIPQVAENLEIAEIHLET